MNQNENSIYKLNRSLLKKKPTTHPILGPNGLSYSAKEKSEIIADSLEHQFSTFKGPDLPEVKESIAALRSSKWHINETKTSAILFGRTGTAKIKNININNVQIPWSRSIKYLGVTIDRNFSFSTHASNIIKKATQIRGLLYPILNKKSPIPTKTKLNLFKMYIVPILTYAGEAWAPFINSSTWKKIEAVQTTGIRIILGQPTFVRNSVLLHSRVHSYPTNHKEKCHFSSYRHFMLLAKTKPGIVYRRKPCYQVRQAHIEAKRLASLTSEATGKKYEQRLNLLKNIAHLWENDKIITTAQIDELNKMDDLQDVDVAACDFNNAVEHDLQDTSEVEECKIDDVKIYKNIVDEVDELRDELPTLSLRIPKRGRPKGKDKTVIGVPKKRKLQSKLIPFEKLPINIRQFKILKCFVNEDVARTAVHDKILINENYIEMIPDKISNKIIDELVAIDEVRCYFTDESWLAIQQIVKLKKKSATWNCAICLKDSIIKSICCNRYEIRVCAE
ncbi:hypothetical protein AGLY_016529 [Aphis glycines]|uniref:Reverse transcriptase domain-containing protein n=1 Tax=Aphis glycines TaxID=307491 RepID=A0A6G0SYA3_APHGL|nr:hypothetical protein AGLY_016529 [Aphis glycines]